MKEAALSERILSLVIGYLFGNFLTAEVVTRHLTGKPCSELGRTGNPGMANVMAYLGFRPGIIVLIGDLLKTVLAALISYLLFRNSLGHLAVLYAGLGTTLGHNFPFWQKFKGGKGVATTCAAIFQFSPLWGLLAMITGMIVVFITQYLSVGGVVIPAVYAVFLFLFYGPEAGVIGMILTVLMFQRHWSKLVEVCHGTCEKTDVLGKIFHRK